MSRTAALSVYRLYPAIWFGYAYGHTGTAVFSRPRGKATRSRLHPHLLDRRHGAGQPTAASFLTPRRTRPLHGRVGLRCQSHQSLTRVANGDQRMQPWQRNLA